MDTMDSEEYSIKSLLSIIVLSFIVLIAGLQTMRLINIYKFSRFECEFARKGDISCFKVPNTKNDYIELLQDSDGEENSSILTSNLICAHS